MVEIALQVVDVRPGVRSVETSLRLGLRLRCSVPIQSGQLVVQVRFEPRLRRWSAAERALLEPLFGPAELWSRSTDAFLWTQTTVPVPAFERETERDVPLRVTLELEHAMGKLLAALSASDAAGDRDLPIAVLCRGTLFRTDPAEQRLVAFPFPHLDEAPARVDATVVREALDRSLGGRRPLSVRADLFDRLSRFRLQHGAASVDDALTRLLERAEADEPRSSESS